MSIYFPRPGEGINIHSEEAESSWGGGGGCPCVLFCHAQPAACKPAVTVGVNRTIPKLLSGKLVMFFPQCCFKLLFAL